RHGVKSTIIASQLAVADWYDILSANTTAADAILDRIVHTAQRFVLEGYGKLSIMWERVFVKNTNFVQPYRKYHTQSERVSPESLNGYQPENVS
ncbi:MAG: ATP-binding protein, partial [Bacteroidales bacterium]|nr:ATP-binding protein [Bacteroidales bacterium]